MMSRNSTEIIVKKLVAMDHAGRKRFARMTVDLIRSMIFCPQVVLAAVDGLCAGAGMALACASFMRFGTERAQAGCLFNQMGLSGADMGVAFFLPKLIGAGRAARLLSFRLPFVKGEKAVIDPWMNALDGLNWGFYQAIFPSASLITEVQSLAHRMCLHNAPAALRSTKDAFYKELGGLSVERALALEEALQGGCMVGRLDGVDEMDIGLAAFLKGEEPAWPPLT